MGPLGLGAAPGSLEPLWPYCSNSEIPALQGPERVHSRARAGTVKIRKCLSPRSGGVGVGRREISRKAAPPLGPQWPAAIKGPDRCWCPVGYSNVPSRPSLRSASVAMASSIARLLLPVFLALLGALLPGESEVEAAIGSVPAIWAAPSAK